MRIDEIERRKAEIMEILQAEDTSGLDVASLTNEIRSLAAEAEELRAKAAAEAELRNAVAPEVVRELTNKTNEKEERKMFTRETKEYRNAWFKNLMGLPLTAEERSNTGIDSSTSSGGYAIPTITYEKILTKLVRVAPLINEVKLLRIAGNVSIAVEGTRNAASIHTEGTAITAQDDTLIRVTLGAYEITKFVPISMVMDNNSIDGLEYYLVEEISRSIAELIENYLINGTGSSQPKGINAITWVTSGSTQNAVDWASTSPTVAEIETQMGLLNGAYVHNAKWLMNWNTFMSKIHVLRDDKKEAVFTNDGGKYYIFGFPVVFSSKVANGDLFFGDIHETVVANMSKDVEILANRDSGFRYNTVDYKGCCLFDCTVIEGRMTKGAASF